MACLFQNDMAVDEINREPLFGVMLLPVAVPFPRLELTARHADELGYDTLWLFDHLDTPHAEPGAATLTRAG